MANNGPVPLARAVDIIRGVLSGLAHAHAAGITHGDLRAEQVLLAVDGILLADVGIAATLGHRTTPRDDMAALVALVQEMLTSGLGSDGEEKLETSRSLPPWLTDWLRTRWTDAGKALAAIQLPPSPPHSGPRAPQPFV
jgi:serine/threonine protein kinase